MASDGRGEFLHHWLTLDAHEKELLLRGLRLPMPLRGALLKSWQATCDLFDACPAGLQPPEAGKP